MHGFHRIKGFHADYSTKKSASHPIKAFPTKFLAFLSWHTTFAILHCISDELKRNRRPSPNPYPIYWILKPNWQILIIWFFYFSSSHLAKFPKSSSGLNATSNWPAFPNFPNKQSICSIQKKIPSQIYIFPICSITVIKLNLTNTGSTFGRECVPGWLW